MSLVPSVVASPAVNESGKAHAENVNGKITPELSWPHFAVAGLSRVVSVIPMTLANE